MADITEIKCPCCGGALKFDAKSQNIKCPYCDTEFTTEDLKEYDHQLNSGFTEKTEFDKQDSEQFTEEELADMNAFICDSCGGQILAGPHTAATSCPYCGNPVLIKGRLTMGYKPKYIIPFKKEKTDAVNALSEHIKKKPLLPKVFKSENKVDEIKAIYVPYWLYDADVDARIQYDATKVRRWSDANADYVETSYYNVIREGNISFDHLPVDASSSIPNDLTESIEPYDFKSTTEFKSTYLAGFLADKFDVTAEENAPRAVERMKNGTKDAFYKTVNGYDTVSTKNVNVKMYNTHYDYALYPMYIMSTTWRDTKYTFAMNGETGKFVGNLPVSKALAFGYFMMFFAIFAVVLGALGGVIGYFKGENGMLSVVIGIVIGVVVGLIITIIIIQNMKKKNKSVARQYGSQAYYRENSMKIRVAKDQFLYKKVVKHEHSKDN